MIVPRQLYKVVVGDRNKNGIDLDKYGWIKVFQERQKTRKNKAFLRHAESSGINMCFYCMKIKFI